MNRLTRIYTRTGDHGTTGLADGSRTLKTAARVVAMGEVDELNAHLGRLAVEAAVTPEVARLDDVQHALFDLGGELALPGIRLIEAADVEGLESDMDAWNAELPVLQEFILPGGSRAVAEAHLCRAVCRRAERALTALAQDEADALNPASRAFVNRLSDWLFVLSRRIARREGGTERYWSRSRRERARDGANGGSNNSGSGEASS
jgi:cob(I)alamin adenosyltransferase